MARLLTQLRVTEVSSCRKGAGDDCRVVIWKRADAAPGGPFAGINLKKFHRRDETTAPTAKVGKTPPIRQEIPKMHRAEELRSIAKDYGVAKVCKFIVDEGRSHGITESELCKLVDDEAQKYRKAGERPNTCFERFYNAPENLDLRKAIAVCKGTRLPLTIEPRMVGGEAIDVNDVEAALKQLRALAELQRARAPWQSEAQAFAAVFEARPDLAARAHRRPSPTTSYAFPR
jgi:hypothetical protein